MSYMLDEMKGKVTGALTGAGNVAKNFGNYVVDSVVDAAKDVKEGYDSHFTETANLTQPDYMSMIDPTNKAFLTGGDPMKEVPTTVFPYAEKQMRPASKLVYTPEKIAKDAGTGVVKEKSINWDKVSKTAEDVLEGAANAMSGFKVATPPPAPSTGRGFTPKQQEYYNFGGTITNSPDILNSQLAQKLSAQRGKQLLGL